MALIEWRKEFETGISDVDHEHRQLIGLINDLHRAMHSDQDRETVATFLGEVFARISAHFALEETVMRRQRYDEYEAHKAEHEDLLDDLRDIMDAHEAGNRPGYEDTLSAALSSWFMNHFKTKDARLHRLLRVR
ncbi:MAG: bacteriohemerythrin [Alphaproteobacteria bacterium]